MNYSKIVIAILTTLLLVSIVINAYYASQTLAQSSQSSTETQLEMTQLLSKAQVSIEAELKQIGDSLIYASQQLSATGISGDHARAVIIVEPSQYQSSEGKNVGEQEWL